MTVLAIEAAIGGGSIAILSGDTVHAKWHERASTARSEHLLKVISELLKETSVDKSSLTRIAVSNGPGSYTGIRIGLATAMSLSRALNIPVAGISAMRAIANSRPKAEVIVVVPLGRSGYCWQIFSNPNDDSKLEQCGVGNQETLLDKIVQFPNLTVIAHADAYQTVVPNQHIDSRPGPILDFGYDVAVAVGTATESIDEGLSPFYAREACETRASPS